MEKKIIQQFIDDLKKEFPETNLDYLNFALDRFVNNNPNLFTPTPPSESQSTPDPDSNPKTP